MSQDQQELAWIYKLYRLGRATDEGIDPSEMWQQLLENIVGAFKAHSGCLAEVRGDRGNLRIQAGIGLPDGVVGSEMAAGSGILGLVASEARPRLLNGNLADDQKLADRLPKRTRPAPWSAMCWPLIVEGRVVGVISANRSQEMEPFSAKDLERGERLIEFIAVAVENIQLHLKSAQYVAELKEMNRKQVLWKESQEWLSEAQAELEKTGDLKQFCTQAATQAEKLLSSDWGALLVEGKTPGDLSVFSSSESLELKNILHPIYEAGLPIGDETRQSDTFRVQNDGRDGKPLLNAIGAPILMPGLLKGILMVGNGASTRSIETNDEVFLSSFAMSVQRTLERIQLMNSLRRANHALKVECEELRAEIKRLTVG